MMIQEVTVPLQVYPEYLDVQYANPVVHAEENIVEVQQMQTIERIAEVF